MKECYLPRRADIEAKNNDSVKVQTLMLAKEVVVLCPHCNAEQDGCVGNPAGGKFECEDCGR